MSRVFLLLLLGVLLFGTPPLRAAETVCRVGIYANPPLAFLDEAGEPSGFIPELLKIAGQGQPWRLSYISCGWAECLDLLQQGKIDLLAPIAYTPERAKAYDFTETTLLSNWGQIFTPSAAEINSILDLDGQRVAVLKADVFLEGVGGLRELARNFGLKIQFLPFASYSEALSAVQAERADAALVNRVFGAWHREDFDLRASSILLNPVDIRLAFARGQARPLQQTLEAIFTRWQQDEGSPYHQLLGQWLSPVHNKAQSPWILPLILSGALLLLVMWLVMLQTRWQVRLKTLEIKKKNDQLYAELQSRLRVEQELAEREQQYRILFEGNHSVILLVDFETAEIVEANHAASRFYGYSRARLSGMHIREIYNGDPEKLNARLAEMQDGKEHQFETVQRRADGSLCDVGIYCGTMALAGRKLICAVIHDISERRRFQAELIEQYEFLQTIIDGVTHSIKVVSPDFKLLLMNRLAAESMPEAQRQPENFCCYELFHQSGKPCSGEDHPCLLEQVKITGEPLTLIHRRLVGDEIRSFEVTASPLWYADGTFRGIIEAAHDVTDRLRVEELLCENEKRLQHIAHHDPLTGLPNRLLFEDRLRHALAQAQRSHHMMALIFIDLDRFKNINDSLGHEIGDRLLVEVASRLRASVREVDTVARLGGDEFLILLEQVDSFQIVTAMAQRVRQELSRIAEIDGYQLVVTGSLGISMFPEDAACAEDLIKCADVAMYHAKSEGKDNYQFYTARLNARAHELLLLESDLRLALEERQLSLYYQPQVDLTTGKLMGVEALLRWNHPRLGLVPPGDFIPLAEETGLILPIGEWVLREACRQQVAWLDQGFPALRMAVNISGRQLKQRDFIETVDQILGETGINPADLELEITESLIMRDVKSTILDLTDLRMRGIRLSIDDFGTGYSSLSYLNRFPVDQLKIDLSFVHQLTEDLDSVMIVDAIIALGRSMSLEVIAEGIEVQQQIEILAQRGCHLGQGFLFSQALPENELRQRYLKPSAPQNIGELPGFHFNFPELKI